MQMWTGVILQKKIKFRDGIELQRVGAYKIDHLLKMGYRNTSNHKNV